MSLLVPSGSPSFTSFLHHHVSLGPQRVSVIHLIPPSPCLSWSPAGLLLPPHYSTTMSLLGPSGSPSFTTLLHHHVSLGPQRVSFLHPIAPPPCLSWSPRISFVHIIAPPPCRSWSPAGLLPSPHYSTTMYLLVPSGSPSFTSLLHNHVSLGPQRVSFLHIITPPPCLSWSRVDLLPPPHCSTIMLLLVPSRSPSFTPIAPPPCISLSPAGLLRSPHCSTTMSILVTDGSPSFTSLLHHHVSLGPQRVSFLHIIAPPPCPSWSPAGLLRSPHCSTTMSLLVPKDLLPSHHCSTTMSLLVPSGSSPSPHCSTTMYLLVPSGSTSFTSLLHHHVYLGHRRVSFLHIIAPPPCLSWSPAGLLRSHHCSTTMSFLVPSGSPSFTSLLHHHVSLGPQRVSFLHLITPPPCLS